jgi:excisionase family DNA binding protein
VPQRTRDRPASSDWIGLREATEMLGISASTLRRWADEGSIRTFVTPGGHRRFSRAAVESLLPGSRHAGQAPASIGESPAQMSRVYRREMERGAADGLGWTDALTDEDRMHFREHGRRIVRATLAALEASDPDERDRFFDDAAAASADYGRAAATLGMPISATVATYLRFRRPFLSELSAVARRRSLDAATTTEMLDRARDLFDRLVVGTVRAQEASEPVVRIVPDARDPEVLLP